MATAPKKEELKKIPFNGHSGNQYLAVRMLKMMVPLCDLCQSPSGNHPAKWWERCPHNPYFDRSEIVHEDPIITVQEDGRKRVTDTDKWIEVVETPRFWQIPAVGRIDNGRGVEQAREYGYKLPQEMGYAPFCMFRDCWSQDITVRNGRWGEYCNEFHLKLIVADQRGKNLEFFDMDRRQQQIDEINV